MGCDCCKELSQKDYKECQSAMELIKSRKATSTMTYIAPCGEIGRHLFTQMIEYNMSEGAGWTQGESWSLGDSPAIALAINPGCGHYKYVKAPLVMEDTSSAVCEDTPQIRLYTDVDSRYILEDLIAKLELFSGRE